MLETSKVYLWNVSLDLDISFHLLGKFSDISIPVNRLLEMFAKYYPDICKHVSLQTHVTFHPTLRVITWNIDRIMSP